MPQIQVKLYAMLRECLPPGSRGVAGEVSIDGQATVRDVLDRLAIPPQWRQLVVLNDQELPPDRWDSVHLQEGDRLAVFPPVAGGASED
jgi:sulfur-carrier protein